MNKLIITADDYGMSPLFNRGIEELANRGIVTGTPVMIKRKYLTSKGHLKLCVPLGLHLEFKAGDAPTETEHQIRQFQKRFGQLPAYLDGHLHQHLVDPHFPEVIQAAQKFRLPVRSRQEQDRRLLKKHGIRTPENFISWHPDRLEILTERMSHSTHYTLSELVVHPGYTDPQCTYPYNEKREEELTFLNSPQFQALMAQFVLSSYRELTE